MPLRYVIKPAERLMLNGVMVQNGGVHKLELLFQNQARFVAEPDLIEREDVNSPASSIYYMAMLICGGHPDADAPALRKALGAYRRRHANSATAAQCDRISELLAAERYRPALRACRLLLDGEGWQSPTLASRRSA